MMYEFFKEQCQYWIDKFGLHYISWMFMEDEFLDEWANSIYSHAGRACLVNINPEVYEQNNAKELLKWLAYHEICEVLLCKFVIKMLPDELEMARHDVIHHFAHALGIKQEEPKKEEEDGV